MTKWILRCNECGSEWVLEVSFDLTKLSKGMLYHFCPYCRKNTFHTIVRRVEERDE